MVKVPVLAAVVVAALSLAAAVGSTARADHITRCFGELADMNRSHDPSGSFLVLTPRHDVVLTSQDKDHVEGRRGRDFICALGGDDEILGGRQADKLSGGRGRDEIAGGFGDDLLVGGAGRDRGNGGPGRDTCVGIEVRASCEVVR